MDNKKISAGTRFPAFSWEGVGGARVDPASDSGWRTLVIYRGKHCPLCKAYLHTLNGLRADFASSGIRIAAVSADPQEKAEAEVAQNAWAFPVGYGLSLPQMRELGLYISAPRSPQETDRPFSEPALFVINPEGLIQIVDISNAPFARPDLGSLLKGLQFIISNDYPIRGLI